MARPDIYLSVIFRWLAVFVMVLVVSIIGSLPVFSLGLIVREAVSNSLTIMVMGLLSAISSIWLSNLLKIGGMRRRLLPIVVTSEITAAILALTYFLVTISPAALALRRLFPVNIYLLVAWGVLLSVSACLAAWRFRNSTRNLKRNAITSLVLLVSCLGNTLTKSPDLFKD